MAIKWKSKLLLITWILLFTFGLSGILSVVSQGSEYLQRDYFQTKQFQSQLNEFVGYLDMFNLSYMPKKELVKKIVVTEEEINEYRYRYGNLADQIQNINSQYEQKIYEAQRIKNQELANVFIAERDQKIEDITNNFKSDEHVRGKIIREKQEQIDAYYLDLEKQRPRFRRLSAEFKYYLEEVSTGEVYTNLGPNIVTAVDSSMNNKNMLFIHSYPTPENGYLVIQGRNHGLVNEEMIISLAENQDRTFKGKIAIAKSASARGLVLNSYHEYQQRQKLFLGYIISAMLMLLISFYLYRKTSIVQIKEIEKWQSYYNRIPIDVVAVIFVFSCLITMVLLTYSSALHLYGYFYNFIKETVFKLLVTAFFLTITVIQGKLLFERVKDQTRLKAEWKKSLIYRAVQRIKEAFLIRSIGTQILLLLCVVFVFGAGATVVLMKPEVILLYIPLFMVIGLPILVIIIKRTGYFNRIVTNTSEIVKGNLESDLPVNGKSALATLADNINKLKQGVKMSQKEQAKSERLKTELITNVSHDLRTPLTSIITYTELLKTPNLTEEEREGYVQIIDRKSKRLKVLIEDLFEASKMASGSIELLKEKVDIVQLLHQALAEHNETISESTLQFRISTPDKPLYAIVDGQKLWRVFDNLIGNILKYSLENTRVYISVNHISGKAVIVFKNVTKYELGQDIDELFERFKRGDTSRHTEGSGLGLAIAKSIIDLHGGILDIELDGDLFKITITLNTALE